MISPFVDLVHTNIYERVFLKNTHIISNNMKKILTVFLLCLSLTLIAGSLLIPSPEAPKPTPEAVGLSQRSLLLITSDLLSLMSQNPYTAAGIYTENLAGKQSVTTIPSWKDLEVEFDLTPGERAWYITAKTIEALTREPLRTISIFPAPKPNNFKV